MASNGVSDGWGTYTWLDKYKRIAPFPTSKISQYQSIAVVIMNIQQDDRNLLITGVYILFK